MPSLHVVGGRPRKKITRPGIYTVAEDTYHNGRRVTPTESLSHSGAKLILAKTLRHYRYQRDHGAPWSPVFDFGTAAHTMVLRSGDRLTLMDFQAWLAEHEDVTVAEGRDMMPWAPGSIVDFCIDDWRTPATRDVRDKVVRPWGLVPLKTADADTVEAMAAELRGTPDVMALIEGAVVEQAMYTQDAATGVWLRGKADVMRPDGLADYKTSESADPWAFQRKAVQYGYHMQAAWYTDQMAALGAPDVRFAFIVQEKTPPYAATVVYLDDEYVQIGREANRRAIDLFASALESGVWPGYPQGVTVPPPGWLRAEWSTETADGPVSVGLDGDLEAALASLMDGEDL